MSTESEKLLKLLRWLIILGVGGFVAFWAISFTWLAFNH